MFGFKRPTMGDRMDLAAERRRPWWQKAQSKAEAIEYERAVRQQRYRVSRLHPYRGSHMERNQRNWGK